MPLRDGSMKMKVVSLSELIKSPVELPKAVNTQRLKYLIHFTDHVSHSPVTLHFVSLLDADSDNRLQEGFPTTVKI